MRNILTVAIILFLLPKQIWANDLDGVQKKSVLITQEIQDWDNTLIKETLISRYQDNMYLLKFLAQNKVLLQESDFENDEDFKRNVQALINDQMALNYFSEHLMVISKKESLDLDHLFQRKKALHRQYETTLNRMLREASAHQLLSRILYISLMEKYANT